jgi:lysophospholipase L1-like esterase
MRLAEGASVAFVVGTLVVLAMVGLGAYALIEHLMSSKPPAPPQVTIIPPPVGSHPHGDAPWFLVVGDSIAAGVYPGSLGAKQNPSFVAGVAADIAARGLSWEPDDLACPGETTTTYLTGCAAAFTNPLLSGKPSNQVALADIAAHRATLRFILIELGSNDLRSLKGSKSWMSEAGALLGRLQKIVEAFRGAAPQTPILIANYYNPYVATDPDTIAQAAYVNGGLAELAQIEGATVVDFASAMGTNTNPGEKTVCELVDCQVQGIHPTAKGAARLAQATVAALESAGLVPTATPTPSGSPSPTPTASS